MKHTKKKTVFYKEQEYNDNSEPVVGSERIEVREDYENCGLTHETEIDRLGNTTDDWSGDGWSVRCVIDPITHTPREEHIYIDNVNTNISIFYDANNEIDSVRINGRTVPTCELDTILRAAPIELFLYSHHIPEWTKKLELDAIHKFISMWATRMVEKYPPLEVKFDYNEDSERYLYYLSPKDKIEGNKDFFRDEVDFTNRMHMLFGKRQPTWCSEEIASTFKNPTTIKNDPTT